MAEELIIREILDKDDPALGDVVKMFQSVYDAEGPEQMIRLADDGAEIWLQGVLKGLGRFGVICIAGMGGKNVGFAHGSLRFIPDFYGSHKVGYISHVFVDEKVRKNGVGEALVRKLEQWFAEKKVHSVELEVLITNKTGIAFWEKLGYPAELLQSRKMGDNLCSK